MKTAITILTVLFVIVVTPSVIVALNAPVREVCIDKRPQVASQQIGYELIDLMRREAWVTTDWTLEDYAEFSVPVTALNWIKNQPRDGSASRASVLRSPGCERDGQFTFMNTFGREFFHIADVTRAGLGHGPNGTITEAAVFKYHRLQFDAGQTVSILVSPQGDRFIRVNRTAGQPVGEPVGVPALPKDWELHEQTLDRSRQVDLFGEVRVLRLRNGTSYQGPIEVRW